MTSQDPSTQDAPPSPQNPDPPIQAQAYDREDLPPPQQPEADPAPANTLTLEIPDNEDPDPDQDDPEEIPPFSPSASAAAPALTASCGTSLRRGPKRKKMEKRRAAQEKTWNKKLEVLSKSLNLLPFVPGMAFDFASREDLLRRVGLWDFVHLEFDTNLRRDLITQLIASFSKDSRVSYVNGVRIKVSRADLGRALRLPRKDKVSGGENETKGTEDEIGFMEKFVMNWLLLHDDTWMMPGEVLNWMSLIKEGSFEKVDWAGLIWFMVEKELLGKPDYGNCYYASQLQCLIKHQKEELLEGGVVKVEVDIDEDDEVRVCEEVPEGHEMEECSIGLSLGGLNDVVKDEEKGELVLEGNLMNNEDKEEAVVEESVTKDDTNEGLTVEENVVKDEDKEDVVIGNNVMNFEDGKLEDKNEQVITASMDGSFLGRCNQVGVEGADCQEEKKHEKDVGGEEEMKEMEEEEKEEEEEEEEEEEGQEEEEEEDREEEEDEEELDEEDFSITPRGQGFEGIASENLISGMEAVQIPYTSGLQMPDNMSSGQFLMSSVEAQRMPGSSSLFGNGNGNKRGMAHLENDFPHHSLGGGNKRMRNDGTWETKLSSDMDICMDEMQQLMEKCKTMYDAKEQAYQEMSMNQQLYLQELQRRENVIQHLKEDAHKKQLEVYKLERELYMMSNLLDGYRKALKGTQKAFSEYRAKCQLPQEPIYKDTGNGGLVLSKMELEKQRLKREEEEKQTLLLLEKKIVDFEAGFVSKFNSCDNAVGMLSDKLSCLEKEANMLKGKNSKRMTLDMPESAPGVEE